MINNTNDYQKPPPREEMAASFLRGCSCVQLISIANETDGEAIFSAAAELNTHIIRPKI